MSYGVVVKARFSAAHRLPAQGSRCSRLHGHTWIVEAEFIGGSTDKGGMLIDFEMARGLLGDALEPLDHSFLNEIEPFDVLPPTAENVAKVLFERIAASHFPEGVRLRTVRVWESPDAMGFFQAGEGE